VSQPAGTEVMAAVSEDSGGNTGPWPGKRHQDGVDFKILQIRSEIKYCIWTRAISTGGSALALCTQVSKTRLSAAKIILNSIVDRGWVSTGLLELRRWIWGARAARCRCELRGYLLRSEVTICRVTSTDTRAAQGRLLGREFRQSHDVEIINALVRKCTSAPNMSPFK